MNISEEQALIIIPDVHGRPFWRYPAVTYRKANFVFLGDYLDPYGHDFINDEKAFEGLVDILAFKEANPNRVTLLLGNHDLHYLSEDIVKGSRYDEVHAERNRAFFTSNRELFQIAFETSVNGMRYLFSHAGVGRMWIKRYAHLQDEDITASWLNKCLNSYDFIGALNEVSVERGGYDQFGSMIWADAREQLVTTNVMMDMTQIFGHTLLDCPMNIHNRIYCLDCARAFYLNLLDGLVYDQTTDRLIEESIEWAF